MDRARYWAGFEEGYRRVMEIFARSATREEALRRIRILKASRKGVVVEPD